MDPDGRVVAVPPNGRTETGPDNRTIAVPEGWSVEVGSNNRAVAIPPGGKGEQGPDGHITPVPPRDFEMPKLEIWFYVMDLQALSPLEDDFENDQIPEDDGMDSMDDYIIE